MKKKRLVSLLTVLLLIYLLILPASAASVSPATAARIAALEDEIAQIQEEMDMYGPSTGVIGQIVSTSPYYIVYGMTVGETMLNGIYYNVIDNPEDGSTDGLGDYAGSHKYFGSITVNIDGFNTICNHFGSMGDEWYALSDEKAAKEEELDNLKNPNYLKESELRVYTRSGMYDIVMQIGNPYIIAYNDYIAIDDNGTVPVLVNGSTLLPIRALIEASGGEVDWDSASEVATIQLGSNTIALKKDSTAATVNGKTVTMTVPAQIINSRLMVPLRFVAESLGMEVKWNSDNQVIQISNKHYQDDLLGSRLTLSNGYYTYSDESIGCVYVYPKSWGKPELTRTNQNNVYLDDARYTTEYATVWVSYALIPDESDLAIVNNPSTAYEAVQLTNSNTGISKIVSTTDAYSSDTNCGNVLILGTNGYLVEIYWTLAIMDTGLAQTLSEVQEVVGTVSLEEAMG